MLKSAEFGDNPLVNVITNLRKTKLVWNYFLNWVFLKLILLNEKSDHWSFQLFSLNFLFRLTITMVPIFIFFASSYFFSLSVFFFDVVLNSFFLIIFPIILSFFSCSNLELNKNVIFFPNSPCCSFFICPRSCLIRLKWFF